MAVVAVAVAAAIAARAVISGLSETQAEQEPRLRLEFDHACKGTYCRSSASTSRGRLVATRRAA